MEATDGLSQRIKLNVGGRVFETTASTLKSAGPDSLLHTLSTASAAYTPVFVDRDPDMFAVLLSLLRTRCLPSGNRTFSLLSLSEEAAYFGLDSLLRSAASRAPFSVIDSSLVSTLLPPTHPSISSFSFNDASSSLLVAHGGLVSCYDPDLLRSSTTPTHFHDITALRGLTSDVVAFGSDSSPGLHFYRLSSSCHVGSFHWSDPSDPRIYKARVTALCWRPVLPFRFCLLRVPSQGERRVLHRQGDPIHGFRIRPSARQLRQAYRPLQANLVVREGDPSRGFHHMWGIRLFWVH